MKKDKETTFPLRYAAVAVSADTTIEETVARLTYDVAAIVQGDSVVGTVTGGRIVAVLETGEIPPYTPVESIMDEWVTVGDVISLESQLRDVFGVFVFAVIRRQTDVKRLDPIRRDDVLSVLFRHVRRQIVDGKYESCSPRMAFGHWLERVIDDKIIDELRKSSIMELVDDSDDDSLRELPERSTKEESNDLKTLFAAWLNANVAESRCDLPYSDGDGFMSITNHDADLLVRLTKEHGV